MSKSVTRFAPSPTGFLHIGGIRTAIYNYLLARQLGGSFLLRIEDTDKERSTQEAIDAILSGLDWLGIQHDGEVYYQSHRIFRHKEAVETLLDAGKAYKCYCTPEELAAMREQAKLQGKTALYDGTWRDRDDLMPEGTPFTVRLKVERKRPKMQIQDLIQGDVEIESDHIDDFVLLRSDGSPTYMLSVVVDDIDMQISHVIRGVDHLTNTFRQIALYEAFQSEIPCFGHIGLLHGDDGKKLSKRHGALGVESYRDMGFLPEALLYYLAGIGCAPLMDEDRVLSIEEMQDKFSLEKVGAGAAQFNKEKLISLQECYLRSLKVETLFDLSWPIIKERYPSAEKAFYLSCIPILIQRSKNIQELTDYAKFFMDEPCLDHQKPTLAAQQETLQKLYEALESVQEQDWQASLLQETLKAFGEKEALSFGKFGKPLRIALSGATASPGNLSEILALFGRSLSLKRIEQALLINKS